MNLVVIKGTEYTVLNINKENKIALLRQSNNLEKCLKFGGQYAIVKGTQLKKYLTLDCANELFKL